ncbi:U-box domain-containing protein 62 [Linum grandiflorum]
MSTQDLSLVSSSRNTLNSQLIYQEDPLRFTSHPPFGDPGPKTRELAGFIDDKLLLASSSSQRAANRYFAPDQQHRRGPDVYRTDRNWSANGNETSGDGDKSEEEEEEEDDDEELDVSVRSSRKHNGSNNEKTSNSNSDCNHGGGSSGTVMVLKDGGDGLGQIGRTANAGVTTANLDGEIFSSRYLETGDGSSGRSKEIGGDSNRKDCSSLSNESGESLRAILSDPVTGALMDDAMILLCGHSFGNGGVQHALRTKSCYTCSRPVSEESISTNLALRAAVQAYRREEELHSYRLPKRRRDRFEERGSYGDANTMDPPRGRGVQFPFSVTDRVIIKGNKRTPERFVGREAIVTTQCLNGWYVVKTLDNAESVKLQYRSLAKVTTDGSSSKHMSSKITPNWL